MVDDGGHHHHSGGGGGWGGGGGGRVGGGVHITADCQWLIIGAFALLPLAVGVCLHLRRITMSAGDQPPVLESLTTPTAPEATSMDVIDYESIPITVGGDIYPVAVPVVA